MLQHQSIIFTSSEREYLPANYHCLIPAGASGLSQFQAWFYLIPREEPFSVVVCSKEARLM